MRTYPFLVSALLTLFLVFALNRRWGSVPAMGNFLSPQTGFWQNAEPSDMDFSSHLTIPGISGKVSVYFDDRLVPHVFADNDADMYFVQGYLHAKFRLWQMEFQTLAASGRISEILGNDPRFINYDRETRRLGMVYAAENSLQVMEADPVSKAYCDAYTAGVNAYISSLTDATLPIEYKLLGYRPEKWTNLKCCLFLKQMSRTLAGEGYAKDLQYTSERSVFTWDQMKLLYPQVSDSLEPIVPKGTAFAAPGIVPVPPRTADSLYFHKQDSGSVRQFASQDPNNGSNNWAVSGKKTQSGYPILCNDPHLELTFPSIWYEMQLNSPTVNVYGATFPGSPNVIIGYNDSIAFGFTNAERDVMDFYEIKFKDDSRKEYWYNGAWRPTQLRIEQIKVKGEAPVFDTVAYTDAFGPVMYDRSFSDSLTRGRAIACRWTAHDPSNEGLMWYYLDRARNYQDYRNAIKLFQCPGQNMLFASKSGDIALWQQAKFPARWYGQGQLLMPGYDSSYAWQGYIPGEENPHVINPDRGFIESANQRPVDSSYPYFIPGEYLTARGVSISTRLAAMNQITVDDMKKLQNDYFNVTAEDARPALLKYVREAELGPAARKYLGVFREWDLQAGPNETGQTVFQSWWDTLKRVVYRDELEKAGPNPAWPDDQTLLEAMLRDSAYVFTDNINTAKKESWSDDITMALQKAAPELMSEEAAGKLTWVKHKDSHIYHLLKSILPFAEAIPVGGWGNVINATTKSHGPSWRMIVHLNVLTEAYGVYPGGQSGNPGSRYYDDFVDTWARGQYYTLWMMKRSDATDKRVKWIMEFAKG
ncbi:MAG TPA: penicillin acylase family protein [Chitinophagaceae bacterium]|nr:penicillin acylase family protein [Chitinophagaceae bacterium]